MLTTISSSIFSFTSSPSTMFTRRAESISYYNYDPSLGAAAVFAALYTLAFIGAVVQWLRFRPVVWLVMLIAGASMLLRPIFSLSLLTKSNSGSNRLHLAHDIHSRHTCPNTICSPIHRPHPRPSTHGWSPLRPLRPHHPPRRPKRTTDLQNLLGSSTLGHPALCRV